MIPATLILQYIQKHCSSSFQFGRDLLSASEWQRIADHIIVTHGLNPDQSPDSLRALLPDNLPAPLPVVGNIDNKTCTARFFKCPAPNCTVWCIAGTSVPKYNIRDHYRTHDPIYAATMDYKSRIVQRIMIYGAGAQGHSAAHYILLSDTQDIPESAAAHLPPVLSFGQSVNSPVNQRTHEGIWLEKLGWTQYLKSLGPDVSVDVLRALVRLPSKALLQETGLVDEVRYVEMGLLELSREAACYLENANLFLESRHENARKIVTES